MGKIIDKEKIIKLLEGQKGGKVDPGDASAPRDFKLIKAIRNEKEYKSNVVRRDRKVRKVLEDSNKVSGQAAVLPGQMIMFDYFEPRTKEELEYYDALPVTIFFNVINTKNGRRVLGFNVHYYPPYIRYQIMDRIFDIFKPIYIDSWSDSLKKKIGGINYQLLLEQLEAEGLAFGVRMYDPGLMGRIKPIPPRDWSKAALTEGKFHKRTREQILNYWKNEFGKNLKKEKNKKQKGKK